MPQTLTAVEQSGLRDFVKQRMLDEIEKVKVAPLAADLLAAFTDDRRHQKLFDEFTKVVGRFLNDEQALATCASGSAKSCRRSSTSSAPTPIC